jgi:hypothetical protein
MAFIEHPDQIWTVDQFNSFCNENKIDMKLTQTEDPLGAHNKQYNFRNTSYQFTEGDKVQVLYSASEAYAVITAVDRLKDVGEYKKFTADWRN